MMLIKQILPSGMVVLIEAENDRNLILNSILDTYNGCEETRNMYLRAFNDNQNMVLVPKGAKIYDPETLKQLFV